MKLFERIARGTTKPSAAPSSSIEDTSDPLYQAILDEPQIPDEQKDEAYMLARSLTESDKKQDRNGKSDITVPIAVAAVVGAMAFHSGDAHASNPITRQMAKFFAAQLVKPLSDMYNGIFDAMLAPWFDMAEDASGAATAAYASWADSNNHMKTTTYNENIMREQVPDPQSCELDGTCTDQMASEADESVRAINTTLALDFSAMEADPNVRGRDFRQQMEKDIADGGDGTGHIDTSILYDKQGYDDNKANERSFNVLKNISGGAKHTPTREQADIVRRGQGATFARRMDVQRATRMARRSVANYVMAEQTARRNNVASNGQYRRSRTRIELDEVSRNFGGSATHAGAGGGYRDQIRDFTKPAPLMRQLNLQQGQTNYLLVQELEELKKGNALLGVQLLEMIDRRGRN